MKKLVLGLSLATAVFAGQYEFGAGFGKHNVSNSPLDNYNFLNVRVGKYLPKNHIARLEIEKSSDLTRTLLNVEHYFNIDSKITPYAFVGIGYQWVDNYNDRSVADLGLGAKTAINEKWNAFLEIRGLRDFADNDNHFGAILGITYHFDTAKHTEPTKIEKKDSDNDGVIDEKDNCPNTPMNVKVDINGCPLDNDNDGIADYLDKCPNTPANVKVNSNGCPLDSDNDGVADYLDKCPNTPANVKVNSNGCPLDSDNDGVADYLDKCPNTPNGFNVDTNGCITTYNLNVTFAYNSNTITPNSIAHIEKFAQFLKENPSYKAEIQGYTDSKGNANYNQKLSEKRAKAVYEKLIELGVSANRLSYKGYGENNPIASNDTEEGRKQNRRVVAKLYY